MEAEGNTIGTNAEATKALSMTTVATIKTDYLEEPINVTSFRPHNAVTQEADVPTLETLAEEEKGEGSNIKDKLCESQEEDDDCDGDCKYKRGNMQKKGHYYVQRFRKEWLKNPHFKAWLAKGKSDNKAMCTVCDKELLAGKSELMRHHKGKKHQKKIEQMQTKQINFNNVSSTSTKNSSGSSKVETNPSQDPHELSTVLDEHGISHVLHIVDLRSDTVTQPCQQMKNAMMNAALGDDVFSEDPTVKTLEEKVATLLEKEAALFVPSGTMANLICVMTHCWHRGAEVVMGDQSHLHVWAQGAIAQIGSIYHRTVKNLHDGTFSLEEVQSLVKSNDSHWPILTLVCIENTHNMMGGKALPIQWMDELGSLCSSLGLLVHCDGARLMNAAVALGTSPARLVQFCDSVSLCLNKGLGAPMGSIIAGTKEFIARAQRVRKSLGGGLHQVGMLAAAGLWALDHQVPKLSTDHAHARAIAQSVQEQHSSAITVDLKSVQTNIVLLHCDNIRVDAKKLCQRLTSVTDAESEELGEQVVVIVLPVSDTCVRLMTHCDVRNEDVKAVIKKLQYVIQECDNMMYLEYKINV